MDIAQKTIVREAGYSGTGMFRGESTRLLFKPSPANSGICFVRVDLPNRPRVHANVHALSDVYKRVFLKNDAAEVESIEHLMAALAGLGIDNVEIEINGREVPAGDGSAQLFLEILKKAGVASQASKKRVFTVKSPITVSNGNAQVMAVPYDKGLCYSYTLDFDGSYIERQSYDVEFTEEAFCREIAPARTFGLSTYVEEFKRLGLGKGVTDDNSVIIQADGKLSKPVSMKPAELRFPDEFVRHKILDLIGDLYLVNGIIRGRIIATRSGHSLNVRLAEKIVQEFSAVDTGDDSQTALGILEKD